MENETENIDSSNDEQGVEEQSDTSAQDDKASELEEKNRKLFERAKKAEAELKALREQSQEKKAEPSKKEEKTSEFGLLAKFDKLALKTEGIVDEDEVELANRLKEETGKDMEDLLSSKYFKVELEALRETKANTKATSGVKGGGASKSDAKTTPEYWIAKGVPPTAEQVPDRKTRATIAKAMMASEKSSKMFYND